MHYTTLPQPPANYLKGKFVINVDAEVLEAILIQEPSSLAYDMN